MSLEQIIVAFDQQVNTIILGGYADETISSHLYRMEKQGSKFGAKARQFVDWLFFWQDQHCYMAYVSEQIRRHLPPEFRIK